MNTDYLDSEKRASRTVRFLVWLSLTGVSVVALAVWVGRNL